MNFLLDQLFNHYQNLIWIALFFALPYIVNAYFGQDLFNQLVSLVVIFFKPVYNLISPEVSNMLMALIHLDLSMRFFKYMVLRPSLVKEVK